MRTFKVCVKTVIRVVVNDEEVYILPDTVLDASRNPNHPGDYVIFHRTGWWSVDRSYFYK